MGRRRRRRRRSSSEAPRVAQQAPAPAPVPAPAPAPAPVPNIEVVKQEEKQEIDTARENANVGGGNKKNDLSDIGLGDVVMDFSNAIQNPFKGDNEEDSLKKALRGR